MIYSKLPSLRKIEVINLIYKWLLFIINIFNIYKTREDDVVFMGKKIIEREYVMIGGWLGKNLASMEISCFARRAARTLTVSSRCGRSSK